ncbi:MAG TPA: NAD-dependent epimerase/dehydratase family protein [Chlorobiota bacterium]|nr:NAD-dependent epimerase/dehydratase family protein [Chlorobiota bacterium]
MSSTQPPRQRIVIAGGTGFLGRSLAQYLGDLDYEVVLLSRSAPSVAHIQRAQPRRICDCNGWSASLYPAAEECVVLIPTHLSTPPEETSKDSTC